MRRLFDLERHPGLRYDPVAYVLPLADTRQSWPWPEHPRGKIRLLTNNLGFNEDRPTAVAKSGLRVLVAGDSHTAGVVDPSESFCHVAERRLEADLGRDVEVLNAGVPYTGPACYLGVLRRYLELQPDVFVAVLFVGNDFADDLFFSYFVGKKTCPVPSEAYRKRAEQAMKLWRGPMGQGLNQAYRLKTFPAEAEIALNRVSASFRAMKELCDAHGILFLAVLLPTKMDVEEDDSETWSAACKALEISTADAVTNLELGRRALRGTAEAGVAWLDPTEAMQRSDQVLYWREDYHLGLAGHALLGELLAQRLRALLSDGAPR